MYPHAHDLGVSTFLSVITEDGYREVMLQATPSATQSSFQMNIASAVSQTRCPCSKLLD
jgi:GTP cyclohydrolase FolE2